MPNAYDAIIFDLGGVVINLDVGRTVEGLARLLGVSPNTLWMAFQEDESFFAYERGHLSDEEFLDVLEAFTPRELDRSALVKAWNAMLLDIPPERIRLIQRLAENHRVFVLSNTNALHIADFNAILESATGYADLAAIGAFEKIYFSYEVGHRKPDRDIYSYVVQDAGLEPSRTLFLDDGPANLEGAQAVGLQTQLVTPQRTILELFA